MSNRISEAIKNGPGTITTRLIIFMMPFMLSGAIWAGKVIVELSVEKIMTAIDRVERQVDKIDTSNESLGISLTNLDKRVTRNEDHILLLKEEIRPRPR